MLEQSPAGRAGTPDEVATVAALLTGPDGAFITGSDFLMDGGVTASCLLRRAVRTGLTALGPRLTRFGTLKGSSRQRLGEEAFGIAWAEGQALGLDASLGTARRAFAGSRSLCRRRASGGEGWGRTGACPVRPLAVHESLAGWIERRRLGARVPRLVCVRRDDPGPEVRL
jgi:hypothetical protein